MERKTSKPKKNNRHPTSFWAGGAPANLHPHGLIAEHGITHCGKSLCPAVFPQSLLCTPSYWGTLAVCRGEKPLVHISCPFHCPPHSLFPTATSRWLMDTALARSGSVLGLAGTGSGQHEGSCCSQKLPLQTSHFESLPRKASPGPQRNPRQMHRYHIALFPKGRCPGEAARPWDRRAAGTQGNRLSMFVCAPAPWPWQCPRWRCSCSPGHRACTGSWIPLSVITQIFSIKWCRRCNLWHLFPI